MHDAAGAAHAHLATKVDLYQVALTIIIANTAITFSLLKLAP